MKSSRFNPLKWYFTFWLILFLFTSFPMAQDKKELDSGREDFKGAWRLKLLKERELKDEEFKSSPRSPMAGKARFTIPVSQKIAYVLEKDYEVEVSDKDSDLVMFVIKEQNGKWIWERRAPGIQCLSMGNRIDPGQAIPPSSEIRTGFCIFDVYPTKDGLVLIEFDPMRRELQDFVQLRYFEPNVEYAVQATLEKYSDPIKMSFPTSQKLEKFYYRYAAIHFRIKGKEYKLSAFKDKLDSPEGESILFIPFSDLTSGDETYEVGRFLEIPEPQSQSFILDFNQCFNPLCNYSPAYNCPVPPLENNLDVAIPAGEKTYPHQSHSPHGV